MIRTVVSLDEDDKRWLDRRAQEEGVPMTELVRRAVRRLRAEDQRPTFDELVEASRASGSMGTGWRGRRSFLASGTDVLLDSVVLIDLFNDIEAAARFVRSVGNEAYVTPITRAEVLVGFAPKESTPAVAVLDRFRWLPPEPDIVDLAARLRREHRWKLPDAFQAAAALHRGLRLATWNAKDSSPDRHAFVWIPYTI